jgi:undecaprenyl-diphosphatase
MVRPDFISMMNIKSALEFDARLSEDMRVAEKPGALRSVAVFFAHSGDSWFWGLALILLWAFSNSFWKHWAIVILAAISILAPLVLSLKFLIRRRRPRGDWGMIYRRTDPHSFPSGHAARSFLIAVIAAGLGPAWAVWILWVWAPLVSLARVAMGVHYLSDVVAGLVVGILAGVLWLHFSEGFLQFVLSLLHLSLW